jgi:hypothetical protein
MPKSKHKIACPSDGLGFDNLPGAIDFTLGGIVSTGPEGGVASLFKITFLESDLLMDRENFKHFGGTPLHQESWKNLGL